MKHIFAPLLSIICCLYSLSANAQQLIAPSGGDSPTVSWAIGEVISGYNQTDDCIIVQGILSYIDLSLPVGIETNEWQEKTVIWPSPVNDCLNVSMPQYSSAVYINIYSLNGVLVKQFSLLKSPSTYNVSSLTSGIYSIKFTDMHGKTIVTKKIMKL